MPISFSPNHTEIIFIFDDLPDWKLLAGSVHEGSRVVVLNGKQDGLLQIADYLRGHEGVDAIHILSHGQSGSLQLGTLTLDQAALAERADVVAQIGKVLSDSGDILLYGCDVASGAAGELFIRQWATLTQADVAASTNRTGAASLGGDWVLEAAVGPVESGLGLSAAGIQAYGHALVVPTDNNFDNPSIAPYEFTSPETIGGAIFTLIGPAGAKSTITAPTGNFSITSEDLGKPYGYDLALIFNIDSANTVVAGAFDARITSADGSEFRIVSMEIDTGAGVGTSPNLTVTGYRDGNLVVTDTFNTGSSDSSNSVTYTKNGIALGYGGVLTFNSAWNYVDEIRFTGMSTALAIDDMDFEPGIPPDTTPPTVTSVSSSTLNGTYKVGSPISIQVNFSENVIVAGGTPQLTLETGATDRLINYVSGTGTSTLTFTYTVQAGDTSADLDYTTTTALALNGATVRDAAGNNATLTLPTPSATNSLGNNKAIVIDGVVPTVTSVNSSTGNGIYKVGDTVSIQVNFSEAVTVTGAPQLTLETGATDRTINYATGSGTSTLTFTYTVQAGDTTLDLDYVATSSLALGGGSIRDAAGNDATLTLASPGGANSLGNNKALVVDGVAPAVSGNIAVPANGAYSVGQTLSFTVTFDDNVVVIGTDSTLGLTIGSTARNAAYESNTANSITYTYAVQSGDTDGDGISVGAIALGATTIRDLAGNNANVSLSGNIPSLTGVLVDTTAPTVTSVSVPPNATYKAGQNLDFTVNFNESVTVNTAGGTPRIAITLDTGGTVYASYFSGTGGSALVFRATVAAGWGDADGIALGSALDSNGGTLRDAVGNDAVLTLNGVGATSGVRVDTIAPYAPSLALDALSDTGHSNSDGITSDTTPTLTGSAEAGSTITLYDGLTPLGTTTADGGGNWTFTPGTLADGPHTLTAKATDAAGNQGPAFTGLTVTIDTTAPTLTIASGVPSLKIGGAATITFTFDEDPGSTFAWDGTTGDVVVTGGTLGALSGSGLTRTAIFTPTPDTDAGVASITVAASAYTDAAGNAGGAGLTPTLTFDTLAPATTVDSVILSADTGSSTSDFVTKIAAQTVSGTLSANLAVGESVQVSLDGVTWATATAIAGSAAWTYAGLTLDTSSTLQARVVDVAGNAGTALSQSYTLDTTSPIPAGGTPADDATGVSITNDIVLAFSEALDPAGIDPTKVYLREIVTGTLVPSSKSINGAGALKITLTSALDYSKAYYINWDSGALSDIAGNTVAAVSDTATYNFTTQSAPTPTQTQTQTPVSSVIDGVAVQSQSITLPGGWSGTQMTVQEVTSNRQDSTGALTMADIPLGTFNGQTLLLAQLPLGYGLTATWGPLSPAGSSLNHLISAIQAAAPSGTASEIDAILGGGHTFLSSLAPDMPLLVHTLQPTFVSASTIPTPLKIEGGAGQQAIVLDASSLPAASTIVLNNVDFATIIGPVTVIGGAGSQLVWGDNASQTIFLGADDDELHGGDGDDVIGSQGGNDRLYGDAGNDLLFGGEGDDYLDGGSGLDTARFTGNGRSDYTLRVDQGKLVVTHRYGGLEGSDTLVDVEQLIFTGNDQANEASGAVARLYSALLHRTPDENGAQYWSGIASQGVPLRDIAMQLMQSSESTALNDYLTNSQFVDSVYRHTLGRSADVAGQTFWTQQLEQGGMDRSGLVMAVTNSDEANAQPSIQSTLDFNRSDVATLVRMYDTLLDRKADQDGLNLWIGASESGMTLRDIGTLWLQSPEVQSRIAGMDDAEFVTYLYRTGLERSGSDSEVQGWAFQLDQGTISRSDALLGFTDSTEKIALMGVINTSIETL